MKHGELQEYVRLHGAWLRGDASGRRAYLRSAVLRRAYLRSAVLRSADLRSAVLSGADLSGADLRSADLRSAVLSGADLSGADLSGAVLRSADLSGADLSGADLSGADLSGAVLSRADLRSADLSGAVLSRADLRSADLRSAVLSGAVGIQSQQGYMQEHFEHDRRGFIVYKTFGANYSSPSSWVIEPGSVIEEVCNPDRCTDCGSGVNVATLEWVKRNNRDADNPIWKCRITWKDSPGIIVPLGTDGKIRAERVEVVEVVK